MVCLTDGEKLTKIYLFVSAEYTNVTDTRTDRQTDTRTETTWRGGQEKILQFIQRNFWQDWARGV